MRRLLVLLAALFLVPLVAPAASAAGAAAGAATPAAGAATPAAGAATPAAYATRIELPAGFAPEGIEAGAHTTVYVGSLIDGSIWRGDVRSGRGSVWITGPGSPAVGLLYDPARRLLWVAGGPSGQVRAYSTTTGQLVRSYDFPGSGFLNDLTITDRAVYVTDSVVQRLDVIGFGADGSLPSAGHTLPLTGDIHYVSGAFNANGIVATRGFLIVGQSATNQLFRVNPMTGLARLIDVPVGAVTSPDGLELHGRELYVVRNDAGAVAVLRLDAERLSATAIDLLTGDTDVPSTGTLVRGAFFVVNARFSTPPTPTTAYWISRVS